MNDQENELIPELELSVIPRKLTRAIRVELVDISPEFQKYLMEQGFGQECGDEWDIQEILIAKFPEFCALLHKHYRNFKLSKPNANV